MNSKQATNPDTPSAVSSHRNTSLPPCPLQRDMDIRGPGGELHNQQATPIIILQVTTANHEAHTSAVSIRSARDGLRTLSRTCRWMHAKSLRIHPSTHKPQSNHSISTDHETK